MNLPNEKNVAKKANENEVVVNELEDAELEKVSGGAQSAGGTQDPGPWYPPPPPPSPNPRNAMPID